MTLKNIQLCSHAVVQFCSIFVINCNVSIGLWKDKFSKSTSVMEMPQITFENSVVHQFYSSSWKQKKSEKDLDNNWYPLRCEEIKEVWHTHAMKHRLAEEKYSFKTKQIYRTQICIIRYKKLFWKVVFYMFYLYETLKK